MNEMNQGGSPETIHPDTREVWGRECRPHPHENFYQTLGSAESCFRPVQAAIS